MKGDDSKLRLYFFIGAIALIVVLSYFIIKDFLLALISGFIVAFLIKPIHNFLSKWMNKKLAAFLCIILVVLVILLIVGLIVGNIISQVLSFSNYENIQKISKVLSQIQNYYLVKNNIESFISTAGGYLVSLIGSLPGFFFTFFVTLFVAYYLLADWDRFKSHLERVIPFGDKKIILENFSNTTSKLVYGTLLIGIIDFILAVIGFNIAGLKFSFFFAFLILLAAFIPALGTPMIWIPIFLFLILQKSYYSAIVVLITGLIISFLVGGILRNYILEKKSGIHPVVLLFGILGGVKIFGLFGFVIGPFILGLLINLIEESSGIKNVKPKRK